MKAKPLAVTTGFMLLLLVVICGALYWMVEQVARLRVAPAPGAPTPVEDSLWAASLRQPLAPCWSSGPTATPDHRIRIGSYNIENFSDGVGDGGVRTEAAARRQAAEAAALVAQFNPDILVIQEVENALVLEWLNEGFTQPYPVGYVTRFGDGGHDVKLNIAVLSRLALADVTEIDFGPLRGVNLPPRGVLRFAVPVDDARQVLVYGVHLKSNYGAAAKNLPKRAKALQVVAEDVRRLAEDASVVREVAVIGDMNVDPDNVEFAADTSLAPLGGFHDLWRGRGLAERTTVPTRHGDPHREFPPAAFDRVLVADDLLEAPWTAEEPQALAAGVDTANVDVLPGRDEGHVSDHYPIFIDLQR